MIKNNQSSGVSDYEELFVRTVLPLVPNLDPTSITAQYLFKDIDGKNRYCDFVIQEGDDVRIAIEIDGYDKKGTGTGMTHPEFVDWQRRQAALTSQGWYVLRFANRDVMYEPKRCAEHIRLLLKKARSKTQQTGLTGEEKARLDALAKKQEQAIRHFNKETSIMKHTITAFTVLIITLVGALLWIAGSKSNIPTASDSSANNSVEQTLAISCPDPVKWQQAKNFIGEPISVVGPVKKITSRDDVKGKPTWVEIGAVYPNPNRLTLVIWGSYIHEFPQISSKQWQGRQVCVKGLVKNYNGTPQIELQNPYQIDAYQ